MRLGQVTSFLTVSAITPFVATIGYAAEHAEKKAGIPQLDPTYYPSQLFWLAIFFVAMYVIMSKVALPAVAGVVTEREDHIRKDLEMAHRLRAEMEDLQVFYNRSLRDAEEEARSHIHRVVSDAKKAHETTMAATQERVSANIAETEQFLRGQKDVMAKEVPAMAERLGKTIVQQLKQSAA